jgi:hypothetical protein
MAAARYNGIQEKYNNIKHEMNSGENREIYNDDKFEMLFIYVCAMLYDKDLSYLSKIIRLFLINEIFPDDDKDFDVLDIDKVINIIDDIEEKAEEKGKGKNFIVHCRLNEIPEVFMEDILVEEAEDHYRMVVPILQRERAELKKHIVHNMPRVNANNVPRVNVNAGIGGVRKQRKSCKKRKSRKQRRSCKKCKSRKQRK